MAEETMGQSKLSELLLVLLRGLLVTFAYAMLAGLLFFVVVYDCIPRWTWVEVSPWTTFRDLVPVPYNFGEGSVVLGGWDSTILILFFAPTLAAALAVYVLMCLPCRPRQQTKDSNVKIWVKRISQYQIPPRRFWAWWCEGMSFAELFLVVAWLVLHAIFIWEFVEYYYDLVDERYPPVQQAGVYQSDAMWLVRMEKWCLSFSWVLYFDFTLLFYPIPHSSFLNYLTGLSYPKLIRYHRWIGHSAMLMLSCHGVGYWLYWWWNGRINFWSEFFDWNQDYAINLLSGSLAYFFAVSLWVTSVEWVRRNYFEVFYRMHIIGFLGFLTFAFMHYNWIWPMLPGLVVYAVDVVFRVFQANSPSTIVASRVDDKKNLASLTIAFDKGAAVNALEEIFVCIPDISRWQYHPFSVGEVKRTAAGSLVTVHIKTYGKWTQELMERVDAKQQLHVRVIGPVAAFAKLQGQYFRSSNWQSYDVITMLAGGIAVVPLIALLKEMMDSVADVQPVADPENNRKQQVRLVWICRHVEEFEIMDKHFYEAIRQHSSWLTVDLYCTGQCTVDSYDAIMDDSASDDVNIDTLTEATGADTMAVAAKSGAAVCFTSAHVSAFGMDTCRPVPPKELHPLHLAFATVMAFAGSLFGLVVGYSYVNEQYTTMTYLSDYWLGGLVTWISLCVTTVGLPAFFAALPVMIWRKWSANRSLALFHDSVAGGKSERNRDNVDAAKASPSTSDGDSDKGESVGKKSLLPIRSGRPAVEDILRGDRDCSKAACAVFAGGPARMLNAVHVTVSKLNNETWRGSGTYIDYYREAWEL